VTIARGYSRQHLTIYPHLSKSSTFPSHEQTLHFGRGTTLHHSHWGNGKGNSFKWSGKTL